MAFLGAADGLVLAVAQVEETPPDVEGCRERTARDMRMPDYLDDWESLTPEEQEARLCAIKQAVEPILGSILQVLVPIVKQLITEIERLWETILHTYPNKRVVWLATHHPKERVRKKNRNRIVKWMKLQYKRKGGESDA